MTVRSRLGVWLVAAAFLASACTDDVSDVGTIDYEPLPAPSPTSEGGGSSDLRIEVVEYEAFAPLPGDSGTFDFVVKVINGADTSYSWPDPCPVYTWAWTESATYFGSGSQYLNCSKASDLPPGGSVDFQMEIPGADYDGALRFNWDLVSDVPCDGWGATYSGSSTLTYSGEIGSPYYAHDLDGNQCPYSWDSTYPTRINNRGE